MRPGSTHDLSAARQLVLPTLYPHAARGLPAVADKSRTGAGVGQSGLGQTVAQPAQNENDLVVHRAGPLRRPGTGTAAMPAIQPVTDFLDTGVGTSEAAR